MMPNVWMKCAVALSLSFLVAVEAPGASAQEEPRDARRTLEKWARQSGEPVRITWNEQTQTPALIEGKLSDRSGHSAPWIALGLLNRWKDVYGLNNVNRELEAVETGETGPDVRFVRLRHMLFGTPVWGDELTVEIDKDGVVRRIRGTIHPGLEKKLYYRRMAAAVSEMQAERIAREAVRDGSASITGARASLYYLPTRQGTPLVYVVAVSLDGEPGARSVMVHALTGAVISG